MSLSTFFQRFRPGSSSGRTAASDAVPLSASDIEATRVRARRRLIGMVVLVGAGVVGFPWLFETQPRAMSPDVQIVQAPTQAGADGPAVTAPAGGSSRSVAGRVAVAGIVAPPSEQPVAQAPAAGVSPSEPQPSQPDEEIESATKAPAAQPLSKTPAGAAQTARHESTAASHASTARAPQALTAAADKHDKADKAEKLSAKPASKEVAHADKSAAKDGTKDSAKPASKDAANATPLPKPPAKPASKPAPDKSDKADKADKPSTRYVVQFGAFAEANTAHEARMKVERLGVKTYAQQVDTPAGKRIRVRVGPFADKAEADKAMATIRKAGLAGAVLTL
jgi:DedD protein